MRIRKRQVPLPLSSLSPVPLSDPHYLSHSPVVQLQLHNQPHGILLRVDAPPSDHPNQPVGGGNNRSDSPGAAASGVQDKKMKKKNDFMTQLLKEDDRGREEDRSHDFRKGSSSSGAYMDNADLAQSYSSGEAARSWYGGERAVPLKKRRGSFHRLRPSTNEEEKIMEKNKKAKTKMKTKMNKKQCVKAIENGKEEYQSDQEERKRKEGIECAKKRGRGFTGELMEGSRCSRVNGRGWRCCQQTLVGYSLCEHHLGKGRLRSMNSVRSRSLATTTSTTPPKNGVPAAPIREKEEEHHEDDDMKPLLMATRRRVKLGMVKARSISRLLDENHNNIAATSTVADQNGILEKWSTN